MCKDGTLMLTHGGSGGELTQYGLPDERVQNHTREFLQSKIDIGEGQEMPTANDLVELFLDTDTELHLELKGPYFDEFKHKYDFNLAALKLYELIEKYGIKHRTIVSSFNIEAIEAMVEICKERNDKDLKISFLPKYTVESTIDPTVPDGCFGIGLNSIHATKEIVDRVQAAGKKIGIFIGSKVGKVPED